MSSDQGKVTSRVKQKARELASGATTARQASQRIADYVTDAIPYALDEWDVGAEEVLRKGYGMCAGKALLAAELHRATGIQARFKVVTISGEEGLFGFLGRHFREPSCPGHPADVRDSVLRSFDLLPPHRDHVIVQVLLDGESVDLDLARDRGLDYGIKVIGLWRERKILSEEGPYDNLDVWLEHRMRRRAVLDQRQSFLQAVNRELENIRQAGRVAEMAGVRAMTNAEVRQAVAQWQDVAGGPPVAALTLADAFGNARSALSQTAAPQRAARETQLLDWLYALVRHNVKRGRYWELGDVLDQRRADCLGYVRLLAFLAQDCGLDAGVVEVVQDAMGRYVPHYACLVRLADGRKRLLDPWYGSPDMRHRRLIARLGPSGAQRLTELTMEELESAADVRSICPEHVAALSFYILGNSRLARGRSAEAVKCYDLSLWLYPQDPRTLFNRALAHEGLGNQEQAQQDYRAAFAVESDQHRLLASVEALEPLIELDEKGIGELDQRVYLLRQGYITGKREAWANIARICGMTPQQARTRYGAVAAKLGKFEGPDVAEEE